MIAAQLWEGLKTPDSQLEWMNCTLSELHLNEAVKNKNEDSVLWFLQVKLHKAILHVPGNEKEMSQSSQRALPTEQTNSAHSWTALGSWL